jgi:hypothetical protein
MAGLYEAVEFKVRAWNVALVGFPILDITPVTGSQVNDTNHLKGQRAVIF